MGTSWMGHRLSRFPPKQRGLSVMGLTRKEKKLFRGPGIKNSEEFPQRFFLFGSLGHSQRNCQRSGSSLSPEIFIFCFLVWKIPRGNLKRSSTFPSLAPCFQRMSFGSFVSFFFLISLHQKKIFFELRRFSKHFQSNCFRAIGI